MSGNVPTTHVPTFWKNEVSTRSAYKVAVKDVTRHSRDTASVKDVGQILRLHIHTSSKNLFITSSTGAAPRKVDKHKPRVEFFVQAFMNVRRSVQHGNVILRYSKRGNLETTFLFGTSS